MLQKTLRGGEISSRIYVPPMAFHPGGSLAEIDGADSGAAGNRVARRFSKF